jgi:NAD(P)-dependent dehydrogenase (short-subunit alcohol dehydrogenase family)
VTTGAAATPGPLQGRTALVTGAGQGVGRGIALALACAGADVVVAARRIETGQPVADEISKRGGSATCVRTDVTVRSDVEESVERAVAAFGSLDVVVHNAFTSAARASHRLEDVDEELWSQFSRSAVWASFFYARAAYRHLARRGGRLVLVTSPSAVEGSANIPLYSAVKAAQRAIAKSLARDWGPDGITVNCIAPVAETPALSEAFTRNPDLRERVTQRTPLRRIGDPERDIGAVAVFLASDASSYITGQTIVCDGGSFTGL